MKQIHLDILRTLSAEDPETAKYFNSSLCSKTKRRNGYWTLEKCQEDALKYKTKTEWGKHNSAAYSRARKKGWIPQCCKHMTVRQQNPHGYWTLELCKEEASKYTSRTKWKESSAGSYKSALKNGWDNECCEYMK